MKRFEGIERLYGEGAQRLRQAHVLVVGLGGVGSWAVEALARSGIGALTLLDGDDICVSNVNRQLHAHDGVIGRRKVEVMAERVRAIAPHCVVTAQDEFFQMNSVDRHLATRFDYAIDAIDGVSAKATLIGSCYQRGIPVVTCGGAGGRIDPLRVQVADLAETNSDRLLFFVRRKLRKHYGFPRAGQPFGVPCVFSTETSLWPTEVCATGSGEGDDALFGDAEARLNCEGRLGSATMVTGVFGFVAASLVVNALAKATPSAARAE